MSIINSIFGLLRFNRRNWKAVALCMFAATVFWFFNALNKNYTTNLNLPISFDFNEDNYIAVKPLPQTVRLNVTGMGWDLFRRSLGLKVPPLVVALERPTEVRKIVGSTLPALLVNQVDRFEINFVLTDTLHLGIEPKTKRWITLRAELPASIFKKGFGVASKPVITPDSIFIEGPFKMINALVEPYGVKPLAMNIDENFKDEVEVTFNDNGLIKRYPPLVAMSFDVAPIQVFADSITLQLQHLPKGAKPFFGVKLLPCTYGFTEPFLKYYQKDSIKAVVDLRNFEGGVKKILPRVKGLPPYSQIIKLDSVLVQF